MISNRLFGSLFLIIAFLILILAFLVNGLILTIIFYLYIGHFVWLVCWPDSNRILEYFRLAIFWPFASIIATIKNE